MNLVDTDGDTVYLQYRHKYLCPLDKPLYETIDWEALAKQKHLLVELMLGASIMGTSHTNSAQLKAIEGLVNLLDTIQDDAEAQGYPVVWAHNADDWRAGVIDEATEELINE